MKRILITGAGGTPAVNFIRSLRESSENVFIVGTDCNKYYVMRSEADKTYLIPRADDPKYIEILNSIIEENNLEFLHAQNDVEMAVISERREDLKIKTFLPSKETIKICHNKLTTYNLWKSAGIKVPETILLKTEDDLTNALKKFNNKVWIRDITGAGARGALAVNDFITGKTWIDFKKGWGKYSVSELLEPQSITWMSIWKNGELVVAQTRKRLYWELGKMTPSGISGATGGAVTVSDPLVDDIALKAIQAVDKQPHGILSVDLTYDTKGIPNPTEINVGRFFTTHHFFAKLGLNMPEILLKLAYEEKIEIKQKINPLTPGSVWIRGIDFLPVLTKEKEIESYVQELEERKRKL